jgi:hypothetical protein
MKNKIKVLTVGGALGLENNQAFAKKELLRQHGVSGVGAGHVLIHFAQRHVQVEVLQKGLGSCDDECI